MSIRRLYIDLIVSFLALSAVNVTAQPASLANQIDQYLQARLERSTIPGFSVAVVQGDSAILTKGYGKTSAGDPVAEHTPFAIASLSKAFTATAVMQLVEQGKVRLDAPVSTYIPSFKQSSLAAITVRQLLNQTSGLSDKGYGELAFYAQPENLDQSVEWISGAQVLTKPGQQYHYHNPNYQLAAKVVETASGKPFGAYLQQHIFRPLKMNETRDESAVQKFYPNGLKNGYLHFAGIPIAAREPDWFVEGAAGITSTAADMAKWLRMQLNAGRAEDLQILGRNAIGIMQSKPAYSNSNYGMGWVANGDSSISHGGILWTYSSEAAILPRKNIAVVLLFNSGLNPFIDPNSYLQGVVDIINGNPEPEMPIAEWIVPAAVSILLVIALILTIRRILLIRNKDNYQNKKSKMRMLAGFMVRLIPLLLVIFLPALFTLFIGRVLNYYRLFLMMPDVVSLLILLGLANVSVLITQWRMSARQRL